MEAEKEDGKQSKDDFDDLRERFTTDLGEAQSYMRPIQQRMDRDYEMYRNYKSVDDGSFRVSDLFEYVETVVPIVTNNRIRGNVRSDYPDYVVHAKGLTDILDNTYDINNWDYGSQEILRMALIYRSSFAYTGYDKAYKNGTGKLCIDIVNSRWCLVDPSVIDLDDSRFFFYVQPLRKTQVIKLHPDKKQEINDSIKGGNNKFNSGNNSGTGSSWFKTWVGTVKNFLAFNGSNQAKITSSPANMTEMDEQEKHKNVVAYIHYWYRDDNDEWRVSYWADDVPLKDEANPFIHGGLPYDILSPVKDPLSVFGIPMNEQMDSMSMNRNQMMNYVLENARLHSDPPLLWNTSFGNVKDPESLREKAKETGVIPITNPDMIPLNAIAEYMQTPALPGYATTMFDQLGAIKDATTGVNDSFRGTQQASSGKEVQLQQEAAYTRIKTMIDQFELFNKKIAEKIIVNSMQFHTTTRGFRVKGDYAKYNQDIEMSKAQGKEMPFEVQPIQKGIDPATQEPQHDRTEFFMYANPSEWTKLDPEDDGTDGEEDKSKEVEKAFKVLQMTVEIEAGSSLPQSRLARREEASELFAAQAIDQESLLDTYDWPDREEVMKRMGDSAQNMQKAQAEAAQAEAQANQQLEQQKIDGQIKIEEMKLQGDMMKNEANNNAKLEQTHAQNKGKEPEQEPEAGSDGLAEMVQKVKQDNPEAANMGDEQIIQALTGAEAQGGHQDQGGGLAEQLDQIRQSNPQAAQLSDEELIAAIQG